MYSEKKRKRNSMIEGNSYGGKIFSVERLYPRICKMYRRQQIHGLCSKYVLMWAVGSLPYAPIPPCMYCRITYTPFTVYLDMTSTKCGRDLVEWSERLTVLGSILLSSVTVESEKRQMKQCWIKYFKNNNKNHPLYIWWQSEGRNNVVRCCWNH
jgi:hypothetical protein